MISILQYLVFILSFCKSFFPSCWNCILHLDLCCSFCLNKQRFFSLMFWRYFIYFTYIFIYIVRVLARERKRDLSASWIRELYRSSISKFRATFFNFTSKFHLKYHDWDIRLDILQQRKASWMIEYNLYWWEICQNVVCRRSRQDETSYVRKVGWIFVSEYYAKYYVKFSSVKHIFNV